MKVNYKIVFNFFYNAVCKYVRVFEFNFANKNVFCLLLQNSLVKDTLQILNSANK